jgi:hypothetical protein
VNVHWKRCLFALSTFCLFLALYTPANAQVVVQVGPRHHHHYRHYHHRYYHHRHYRHDRYDR